MIGVFLVWGDALATCTATKQNCTDGYYNKWGCQVVSLLQPTGYECEPCPAPFDRSANGGDTIAECYATKTCSVDEQCMISYSGDTSCIDGVGASGNNHLEIIEQNVECVDNTRSCKDFSVTPIDWGGDWNNSTNSNEYMMCAQSEQSGNATWQDGKWNISGCRCMHAGIIWYKNCNGKYVLKPQQTTVSSVGDLITYTSTPLSYYCTNCSVGRIPDIQPDGLSSLCHNMDVNTAYVACACNSVQRPYYAQGCGITYPLNSFEMPQACRESCPDKMETTIDGATSVNDCIPKTDETYEDSTGFFVLGSDVCL